MIRRIAMMMCAMALVALPTACGDTDEEDTGDNNEMQPDPEPEGNPDPNPGPIFDPDPQPEPECLPTAPPRLCTDGEEPRRVEYAPDCFVDSCEVVECDNAPMPDPPCPRGEVADPIRDDEDCIADWMCVEVICPPVEAPPVCEEGQDPEEVEYARGCFTDSCTPPPFVCGEQLCDPYAQYCEVFFPGVQGAEIMRSCRDTPEACLPDATCECVLEDTGLGFAADCREEDRRLTISIFAP